MTKSLTITVVSYSDIIAAGIQTIVADLRLPGVRVEQTDKKKLLSGRSESRTILFVDSQSIASNEIDEIRRHYPAATIVGVYHSAMPSEAIVDYDIMTSIYSDRNAIRSIIENALNQTPDTDNAPTDELTPREREIVIGVVKGLSNKEIASHLNVSVNTVMTHRRNIASKLQIHSPAALTIYAIVSKLVSIEDLSMMHNG